MWAETFAISFPLRQNIKLSQIILLYHKRKLLKTRGMRFFSLKTLEKYVAKEKEWW